MRVEWNSAMAVGSAGAKVLHARLLPARPTLEPFDPDPDRPDPTRSAHGCHVPAFTVATPDFGLSTIPFETFQDTSRRWVRSPAAGLSKRTQWKSAIRSILALLVDPGSPQSQWIRDPVDGIPVVWDPHWSPQSRDPSKSAIPVKSAIPGSRTIPLGFVTVSLGFVKISLSGDNTN